MISPIMEEYEEIQTNICLCSDGHVLTGCKEITEYTPAGKSPIYALIFPFKHHFCGIFMDFPLPCCSGRRRGVPLKCSFEDTGGTGASQRRHGIFKQQTMGYDMMIYDGYLAPGRPPKKSLDKYNVAKMQWRMTYVFCLVLL